MAVLTLTIKYIIIGQYLGQRVKFARKDRHRLARQDPELPKTVTEIWDWLATTSKTDENASSSTLPTRPPTDPASTTEGSGKKGKKRGANHQARVVANVSQALAPTRAEALTRLQTKIEELRSKERWLGCSMLTQLSVA